MAYTKHTWGKGQIITADLLNNLEDGVDSAINDLDALIGESNETRDLKTSNISASGSITAEGTLTITNNNSTKISLNTNGNVDITGNLTVSTANANTTNTLYGTTTIDKLIVTSIETLPLINDTSNLVITDGKLGIITSPTFSTGLTVGNATTQTVDNEQVITYAGTSTFDTQTNILHGTTTIDTLISPNPTFINGLNVGVRTENTTNDQTTYNYQGTVTFDTDTTTIHGTTYIDQLSAVSGAIGYESTAAKSFNFAIGQNCHATGGCSLAVGHTCTAGAEKSVAFGLGTEANKEYQFVFGAYNYAPQNNQYIEIVGNGTSANHSNARTLDRQGNEWLAGQLTATSLIIGTATTNNDTTTYNGTIIFNTSSNILHGNTNIDELTVNGAINATGSFMLSNNTIDYRLFIQNSGLASFYSTYNNTSYELFSYQPDDSATDPVDTINFGGLTPRSVSFMNLHAINEITLQSNQTICFGNFKIYNNTLTFSAPSETDVTLTKADIEAIKTYCGLTNNTPGGE